MLRKMQEWASEGGMGFAAISLVVHHQLASKVGLMLVNTFGVFVTFSESMIIKHGMLAFNDYPSQGLLWLHLPSTFPHTITVEQDCRRFDSS